MQRWYELAQMRQRVIDGTATEQEALSVLTGLPTDAFPFIEKCQKEDVLKAQIARWWEGVPAAERSKEMTMAEFCSLFRQTGAGAWQIGAALRELGWTSSRRRWKESGPRCRVWLPPAASS